jgi:aminoglycoside phosphotransferase (APT) family kinase protein
MSMATAKEQHPTSRGEADVIAGLAGLGLLDPGETPTLEPLGGGVSSEIWRVATRRGDLCVKRALARLKVAAVWEAPLERSHFEAEWLRVAGGVRPANVPALVAEDTVRRFVVMPFLPPARYPLWKTMLRDGDASPAFAAEVGTTVAAIHAATADDPAIAARFPTDASFHAIRLEPYLEATARVHADVADRLMALSAATAATKRCLVHGDVSPKNILAGPLGPVLLDAECAWFGDPAFDAAFVLNHLMLKCLWTPWATPAFLACFDAITDAYFAGVDWEPRAALEARVAALLPGLLLARIDGKSPVEYVTDGPDKDRARRVAKRFLSAPAVHPTALRDAWERELAA